MAQLNLNLLQLVDEIACRDKQQAWAAFVLTTQYLGSPCRIQVGRALPLPQHTLPSAADWCAHAQVLHASPFLASLTARP